MIEYVMRIGFIIGVKYKLASINKYAQEINKIIQVEDRVLEIRKDYTFERDVKPKVLVMYCIENKMKHIDKRLLGIKHDNIKYVSCKYTQVEE